MVGIIAMVALASILCVAPFGVNTNTENSLSENHDKNTIKASVSTELTNNSNTSDLVAKSATKTVRVVVKSTRMSRKDYREMVRTIENHEKTKGVKPSSYNWKSRGLIISRANYLDVIDRYTRFARVNKREPNFINVFNAVRHEKVTVNADNKTVRRSPCLPLAGKLRGRAGLTVLQKYMNRNLNHRSGGPSTSAGVTRARVGDCWGLAEWAGNQLRANGYRTRIVQGASSASPRHRWVQVNINGRWVNFESTLVTKRYGSKHYSRTCATVSRIIRTW